MHRPCHTIDVDRDCGDSFYVHTSSSRHLLFSKSLILLLYTSADLVYSRRSGLLGLDQERVQRVAAIGGVDGKGRGQGLYSWSDLAAKNKTCSVRPLIFVGPVVICTFPPGGEKC